MTNIPVTGGSGYNVATETVAGVDYQKIEVIGAGGSSTLGITPDGSLRVSVIGTIGASIIGAVPVTFTQNPQSVSGTVNIGSVIGAVTLYGQPSVLISGSPSVITNTNSVLVLSAPGAGLRNYVTNILVSNNAAVSTAVNIVDRGNVIYAGFAASQGGGYSATFPAPLMQPTSNLGLYAQTPTQASVLVAISGFVAP